MSQYFIFHLQFTHWTFLTLLSFLDRCFNIFVVRIMKLHPRNIITSSHHHISCQFCALLRETTERNTPIPNKGNKKDHQQQTTQHINTISQVIEFVTFLILFISRSFEAANNQHAKGSLKTRKVPVG